MCIGGCAPCRRDDAKTVLSYLRHTDHNVDAEITEIEREAEEERLELSGKTSSNDVVEDATWGEVFSCRFQMLIGIGLGVIAAATGVNAIIFYSTQVFAFAGFDEAILATASVGAVNFLATALATYLVDVMGRKQLLEWGMALMSGSLLALALVLVVVDFSEQLQGILAVVLVLIYVIGFAIGIGAVMWVMMCEIMDQRVRSKAFGLFISINWGINLVIGLLTLTAIDALGGIHHDMDDDEESEAEKKGVAYVFAIFGGICFLSQVFIRWYVPETKGKTPNDFVISKDSSIFSPLNSLKFQREVKDDSTDDGTDSAPLLS